MKKLLKQLLAVTTAIMMAITLLPAMANAADAEVTPSPSPIFNRNSATLKIEKHDSFGGVISGDIDAQKAIFKIYQVAKVDTKVDTSKTIQLSYDVQKQFQDYITNAEIQNLGNLQDQSASKLEKKARELSEIKGLTAFATYTTGDKAIPILKENFGLYLVVETKAPDGYNLGAPFFVDVPRTTENGSAWDYAVVATPKNGSNSLDKKVAVLNEKGTVVYKTAASVKTGDTLQYTVTGTLPYLTEEELDAKDVKITISDTLTGGLAFNDPFSLEEFKINGENVKEKYLPVKQGNNQFTITIEANKEDKKNYETNLAYIKSINGKSITLTYQAKVTNAVTYATAATNKATIKVGDEEKSKSNEPEVYTYAIKLNKKLGDKDAIKEDGVQFGLYTDPTCTDENRVGNIKTVENGSITFDGLVAEGEGTTYYLKEEKTAHGYTLLSKPIAVKLIPELTETGQPTGNMQYTIDNDTRSPEHEPRLAETTITNNKGFNLPSTGGMGTYIFTIGGLVVMAGAVLLLVSSKKKRA